MRISRHIQATLIAMSLLAACSEIEREAETAVTDASDRVQTANQQLFAADAQRPGGGQVNTQRYVGPEPQRTAPSTRLPEPLRSRRDISIVSRSPLSLSEIAVRLNEITNVPFVLNLGSTGLPVQSATTTNDAAATTDAIAVDAPLAPTVVPEDAGASPTSSLRIRPNLSGSLGEVLDQVAAAFDVEWNYEDGRIVFRDYVTRRYQVTLLPSDIDTSFEAGPVSRNTTLDFWEETKQTIETMLGAGARVSYGTSTGTITVTARLSDHQTIRSYIAELNEQLGQQVAFDINVLSVILEDEYDLSVSLNAALAEQNINAGFSNQPGAVAGGSSFNVGVTSGSVDIDAVVQSLARRGRVAVETRAGGITTNFQPVPISVTETITYVASQETNFNEAGNVVGTELTTETIDVGFVLLVLPRILNSREVLLNYSISLSTNNGFDQIGDIQLPNTSQKVLDQQAIVSNGQSLVIAGFEERQTELSRQGVGNAGFLGLGGRRDASLDRESTVIIITPRLLTRAATY